MLDHYTQFFKRVQIQAPGAPLLTTKPGVTPPVIDRPFTAKRGARAAGVLAKDLSGGARKLRLTVAGRP